MGLIAGIGGFLLLAFLIVVTLRNRNRGNVAEADRNTEKLYDDLTRKERERGGT